MINSSDEDCFGGEAEQNFVLAVCFFLEDTFWSIAYFNGVFDSRGVKYYCMQDYRNKINNLDVGCVYLSKSIK